jgi:hypothetical protein
LRPIRQSAHKLIYAIIGFYRVSQAIH